MNIRLLFVLLAIGISLWSCNETNKTLVEISNPLAIERSTETVELRKADIASETANDYLKLGLVDASTQKTVVSQWVDKDGDGTADALIFQPTIEAKGTKTFEVKPVAAVDSSTFKVYSRFVPERTDDYTWENNVVAFRTYGPRAQKMVEDGVAGGTLSSGMDCWLKRVDYPIINKWYKKYTDGTGTYHEDTGEGLDNYHVGTSRGCGGIGVYLDETLFTSKNFTDYITLGNGPIRTFFMLKYEDWVAGENTITEKKGICLDLGSNLMYTELAITGTDVVTIGITLHENTGTTRVDTVNGWFAYWQNLDDSELGTGIVVNPADLVGYKKIESEEADKSQLLVHIKVKDGKASYWSGFGWKKAGEITSPDKWHEYLDLFSNKLQNPIEVSIVQP